MLDDSIWFQDFSALKEAAVASSSNEDQNEGLAKSQDQHMSKISIYWFIYSILIPLWCAGIIQLPPGMSLNQFLQAQAAPQAAQTQQIVLVQMPGGSGSIGTMGSMGQGHMSHVASRPQAEEEPLYVNAKQYNRILKRRQARAKMEQEGRIPKQRRVSRASKCIQWEYCKRENTENTIPHQLQIRFSISSGFQSILEFWIVEHLGILWGPNIDLWRLY